MLSMFTPLSIVTPSEDIVICAVSLPATMLLSTRSLSSVPLVTSRTCVVILPTLRAVPVSLSDLNTISPARSSSAGDTESRVSVIDGPAVARALVLVTVRPVSAACVTVISSSAPKLSIAESDRRRRSFVTTTSLGAVSVISFVAVTAMSLLALRVMSLLEDTVRSVPSPSIFSPSSPNVTPTLAGMFTSLVAVRLMSPPELTVRSVPSLSIFSASSDAKERPTPDGMFTSAVAVRLMSVPAESVRLSASPAICSPPASLKYSFSVPLIRTSSENWK